MSNNRILAPVILLVKPQLGENVGMSARAMLNCGVTELRLVAPRDTCCLQRAMAASADCLKQMPEVAVYKNLPEAIRDLQFVYASTARVRHMNMLAQSPMQAVADVVKRGRKTMPERTGFVFGAESSGLDNEDVAQCNAIVTIPLNPVFTSLNLAQAVLLLCWEWRKALEMPVEESEKMPRSPVSSHVPATHGHVDVALRHLMVELNRRGFFKSETSESVVKRNIQTMFKRIGMNDREVQCLHGIVRCLTHFPIKTE